MNNLPASATTQTNFLTPENGDFYARRPYKSLNPSKNEFRVLRVLPGTGTDLVRCQIVEPPESILLGYKCISYRAGSPSDILQIEVNGIKFNAFKTLGTALQTIRRHDKIVLLWADQICINQNEVMERNDQVRKMRYIYENADGLLAWLGRLENSDLASEGLLELQTEFDRICPDHIRGNFLTSDGMAAATRVAESLEKTVTAMTLHNDESGLRKWSSFGHLFRAKFWDRLWIFQELVVSKSVWLVWDTLSIDWDDILVPTWMLRYFFDIEDRSRLKALECLLEHIDGSGLKLYRIIQLQRYRFHWTFQNHISFTSLLSFARRLNCSDVRDRVFAISGLIRPEYDIVPDYTATVQSIFCNTIITLIRVDQFLDAISFCYHPTAVDKHNLPTWCPNWSLNYNPTNRRESLLLGISSQEISTFHASNNEAVSVSFEFGPIRNGLHDYISMVAKGLRIGSIYDVGEVPSTSSMTEESFQDMLKSWSKLISQHSPLNNNMLSEIEKVATVEDRGDPNITIPRDFIRETNYKRLKQYAFLGRRRFILTGKGYMGMAPPHVSKGDIACVLFGGRIPYLLRRQENHYILVGELYLSHEFMKGRAIDMMESGDLQPEDFEIR